MAPPPPAEPYYPATETEQPPTDSPSAPWWVQYADGHAPYADVDTSGARTGFAANAPLVDVDASASLADIDPTGPHAEVDASAPETDAPWDRPADVEWPPVNSDQEMLPWDRPPDVPSASDAAVPDRPAWDRPPEYAWDQPDMVDDRPPQMPERDREPVSARSAITEYAAAEPEPLVADPYDAFAPVLSDISRVDVPSWPAVNGHDEDRNAATVTEMAVDEPAEDEVEQPAVDPSPTARAPITPVGFEDRELGPTPPDDLFTMQAPDPAPPPEPVARPEPVTEPLQPALPYSIATTPGSPANVVVRIELAIVDDGTRIRSVDAVRRVGPSSEAVEPYTPRHPEFEPRAPREPEMTSEPADDAEPWWTEPTDWDEATPPWGEAAEPKPTSRTEPVATPAEPAPTPWAEPVAAPAEPMPAAWIEPVATPAEPTPPWAQPASPWSPPAPTPSWSEPPPPWQPAAPQAVSSPPQPDISAAWTQPAAAPWSEPAPATPPVQPVAQPSPWSAGPQTSQFAPPDPTPWEQPSPVAPEPAQSWLEPVAPPTPSGDPLAAVPAAAFEAASPFVPARPAPAPVQPAASPRSTAVSTATPAAADAADLWFLASEPQPAAGEVESREARQSSSILTGALTIGMALLVIVLVLVFIQLMTSILR
jgi:hypothetical protein